MYVSDHLLRRLVVPGMILATALIPAGPQAAEGAQSSIVVTPAGGQGAIVEALTRARAAHGAMEITLQPGIYRLSSPILLNATDGGTAGGPLRIVGAGGGAVILTGAAAATQIAPPPALLKLLPAASRGKVRAYSLSPEMAAAFAQETPRSTVGGPPVSPVVVTQGEQSLHLAQWPNEGFAHVAVASPQPGPRVAPVFTAPPGKAAAWAREPMLRAGGYWSFDWAYETARVASVDPAGGTVQMPPLVAKYPERQVLRYRVLNAFSELDSPGEYAVDPTTRTLLVWPLSAAPVETAGLDTIVGIDGAHDVAIDGIALQGARGDALVMRHASGVTFTNGFLGLTGGNGASITDSRGVVVSRTMVSDTGKTGISVAGGDKATLTPANDVVTDSVFRRFGQLTRTYQPGVSVNGVGQSVVGNLFTDAPHSAIIFLGNNHRIAGNEITRVLTETGDSGAVYTFQDLSARGTAIEGNYIHGIVRPEDLADVGYASQDRAIYLDGWTSGVAVRGNLVTATPWSVFVNSGSDNDVTGNVFAGSNPYAIHVLNLTHNFVEARTAPTRRTVGQISPAMVRAYHIDMKDPSLTDGYPRRNHIGRNLVIGGQAIAFLDQGSTPRFSLQVAAAQDAEPQMLVPAGSAKALASIVPFAQSRGFLAETSATALDRDHALAGLRYRSLQGQ